MKIELSKMFWTAQSKNYQFCLGIETSLTIWEGILTANALSLFFDGVSLPMSAKPVNTHHLGSRNHVNVLIYYANLFGP